MDLESCNGILMEGIQLILLEIMKQNVRDSDASFPMDLPPQEWDDLDDLTSSVTSLACLSSD